MYFPRGTPNNISKTCHKNEEPNQMCPYVDSLIMDGEPTVISKNINRQKSNIMVRIQEMTDFFLTKGKNSKYINLIQVGMLT